MTIALKPNGSLFTVPREPYHSRQLTRAKNKVDHTIAIQNQSGRIAADSRVAPTEVSVSYGKRRRLLHESTTRPPAHWQQLGVYTSRKNDVRTP